MIFQGIRTSIAKKPSSIVIFQGGGVGPPVLPPGSVHVFIIMLLLFFQEDHVITHKRKEQFAKYDRFLKRFEHSKALDAALDVSHIDKAK